MDDTSLPADRSQPASHPTELCIAQAEDLLGYIPHSMGEWPTESLVAVTVGAGTVGITVRVDLPSRDEDSEAFAAAVCDYLETDALAEAALLVIYTAQPWNDVSAPPRDALVGAVRSALADRGLPVLDAWLVGESHWRSLLCPRISCCPWPGQPIGTILAIRLGTDLVSRGR
ncbi:MAG: DUF4192 family protein, partial [Sinomonas sp.]|nr:DUF4192 family protein [Sinomonas sp.]